MQDPLSSLTRYGSTALLSPKAKRGRPRKYASTEEKKASRIAQQRNQRQSARAAQRAQQFDKYYSTTASLPTDINEPPPTYFPPEELSIATEVEQLLPPLSPDLGPWEPSTLEVPPMDAELPLENMADVSNEPATDTSPESARNETTQASPILETTESSIQATEPFVDSAPDQSESLAANTADNIHDLARVLTDFANHIVLRLARVADPSGLRTLGIISKPDVLVPGSETEASFVSLAKKQVVEFRLGWHVLKNMDSEKGQWSLIDRNIRECEFFSQGIWEGLPRSLVGVYSLRTRLSSLLLGQIASELPSLIDEINEKINVCRLQLQKLGDPRATVDEQRTYLLHISQAFQSLVKAGVDGTYNEPFFQRWENDRWVPKAYPSIHSKSERALH